MPIANKYYRKWYEKMMADSDLHEKFLKGKRKRANSLYRKRKLTLSN